MNFRTVSSARISPDGKSVVWTESSTDWEQNAYVTQLWVARADGSQRRQLTFGKKSASSPAWSPDSKLIGFLSDRGNKTQIHVISPDGGEARELSAHETAVSGFAWAPDGRQIALIAPDAESPARKARKEKYGEFEVVESDYTLSHLWLLPSAGGKASRLTEGAFTVIGFDWSPDNSQIAFTAAKDPDLSHRDTTDLFVVTVSSKAVRALVAGTGIESNPTWSPDGAEIAYTRSSPEPDSYLNAHLMKVASAGGTPKRLAERFDENPSIAAWCAAGLYFGGLERTASALFRAEPASGTFERIGAASGASFSDNCAAAAWVSGRPNEISEVWTASLSARAFTPVKVSDQAAQLRDFKLATREVVEWKSQDGALIEGILIKPRDFNPSRKYPLLVVIHGGPTGIDTPVWSPDRYYPIERFVEKGGLVLRPNYRGSAGYGEKFRSLNVRNLGVGDAWDVISGVDALIAKGFVDRDKVGAMGWSQGGYISAFLTCSSDRFRAISVGAGISDWMTYYVNTDIHPFTRTYLKATPWQDPEIYRKTSPISYVKNARTPTLIQHGELDKRVPPPNAYELYQALKDLKVETRLVIYKGFGHGIDKPKQQRHVLEENEAWFDKHLFGSR